MSIKHDPPRQDRRGYGRAVVKEHTETSVGSEPPKCNPLRCGTKPLRVTEGKANG